MLIIQTPTYDQLITKNYNFILWFVDKRIIEVDNQL